jgi:hypothetical protein
MMSYLGSFNANRAQSPLTIDQIGQYAPSALATMPHESRSSRYTYIPTIAVIEGMIGVTIMPNQHV